MMPDLDSFSLFVFDINTMNWHVHSLRIIFLKYFAAPKKAVHRPEFQAAGCPSATAFPIIAPGMSRPQSFRDELT